LPLAPVGLWEPVGCSGPVVCADAALLEEGEKSVNYTHTPPRKHVGGKNRYNTIKKKEKKKEKEEEK